MGYNVEVTFLISFENLVLLYSFKCSLGQVEWGMLGVTNLSFDT